MHARYLRVWFVAGLGALVLALPLALAGSPRNAPLAAAGLCYLGFALALGLLPAYARRDWHSPVFALAGAGLGVFAVATVWEPRAFHALLGASLLVGALQPLALLLSPRWTNAAEPVDDPATDRAALSAVTLALLLAAAGGLLLVALPRGLVTPALTLLALSPLAAAFAALLFALPRQARAPLRSATLAWAALAALAFGAAGLAVAFAFPFEADFRGPAVALLVGLGLAALTLRRAPTRPPLMGSALALAVLSALLLVLAMLPGAPNALLPAALYAGLALALVSCTSALLTAAPLLLPGRARPEARWTRWGPALLIGALFLYTPALQYGRSVAPAAIAAGIGLLTIVWGVAPLARAAASRSSNARPRSGRR